MNGRQVQEFNILTKRVEKLEKQVTFLLQEQIQINLQMGKMLDFFSKALNDHHRLQG